MQPNAARLILPAVLLFVSGCASMPQFHGRSKSPPPPAITESHESQLIADYLRTMEKLVRGTIAEQAEFFEATKRAAAVDPNTANRMKLALMMSLPSHAGSDLAAGRALLTEILAAPERLLPLEQSLATLALQEADSLATAEAEIQRLRTNLARQDRDRNASQNKRIQALQDENDRLVRDLEEAKAKLDAIANLERTMSGERRPGGSGARQ